MANSTRAELRTKANTEVKIDKLFKVWSKSEYNDAINEALFFVNTKWDGKWETQDKTTAWVTTIDQQFYDRPTDYRALKLIEFDDLELTRTQYEEVQRDFISLPKWTPTEYYMYKEKIGLHPIPSSAGSLKLLYATKVVDLATDTSESPFDPRFDRAIALYTAYILLSQPGDNRNLQRAQTKLSRFNEELPKLLKMFLYHDRENMRFINTYIPRSQTRGLSRSRFRNIT